MRSSPNTCLAEVPSIALLKKAELVELWIQDELEKNGIFYNINITLVEVTSHSIQSLIRHFIISVTVGF